MSSRWRPPLDATTYPRLRGDWTIAHADGTYAAFNPETGTCRPADPLKDAKLPALAAALDRGRLLSYRVGRRAVVATESTFIKVVRPSRLAALQTAHQLADAIQRVDAPAIIGAEPIGSIELTAMHGSSLHALIRQGSVQADDIRSVAHSLASLHGGIDPELLPHRQPDPPQRWIDTVARVNRQVARELNRLATKLPNVDPGTRSIIHGDLHDKNIFISAKSAGFIDLDGLSGGAAECDLANLTVHLKLRALQMGHTTERAGALGSFLYREYAGIRPIDNDVVRGFEEHTWFRLACLYLLRVPDCGLASTIVDELSVA